MFWALFLGGEKLWERLRALLVRKCAAEVVPTARGGRLDDDLYFAVFGDIFLKISCSVFSVCCLHGKESRGFRGNKNRD